jgi:hypothetical protein
VFTALHDGVVQLGQQVNDTGFDPAFLLLQIPSDMGAKIELEMERDFGWRDRCDGIALTADGHRKEINLYGVRIYWKSTPRDEPW